MKPKGSPAGPTKKINTMGKVALLVVTVSLISISIMSSNRNRRSFETSADAAAYQARVIAREIATSSFNVIVARLSRDFAGRRGTWTDVPYGDGTYTVSVTGPAAGPATVTVTGTFQGPEHTIAAQYSKRESTILDAVTLVGPSIRAKLRDGSRASGIDPGSGEDVHAVRSTDAGTHAALLANINPANTVGVDGAGDAVFGDPEVDIDDLFNRVMAYAGPARKDFPSGLTMTTSAGLGTRESPVVLVVTGTATLDASAEGYGVLYVSGRLTMDKFSRWNGLVLVTDDAASDVDRISLKKDASIHGAVVARFATASASWDFSLADNAVVQYTEENLQMLNALIPGIGPSAGTDSMVLMGATSSSGTNADFVNNGRRGSDAPKTGSGDDIEDRP